MTTTRCSPRSQRGLDLARAKHKLFRRIDEVTWLVPSATKSASTYVVRMPRPSCTCPDFDASGTWCKHVVAVAYLCNQITMVDGTRFEPPPIVDAAALNTLALTGIP